MYLFHGTIRMMGEARPFGGPHAGGGENVAKKTKTSAAVKNRYASKAYDRLALIVPKGRKADIEARAAECGTSVNGYIGGLVRDDLGMDESAWKCAPADLSQE